MLERISTEEGARKILLRMIETGKCTLEDLDTPPPGYEGDPTNYRNLLRDYHPEQVQAAPDPRDFQASADTGSAVSGRDSSVPVEGADDPDLDNRCPEF